MVQGGDLIACLRNGADVMLTAESLAFSLATPMIKAVAPVGLVGNSAFNYIPLAMGIQSLSDNASDASGNGTDIPSLVVIEQEYGGSNINDGRNGLSIFTDLVAPTSPTNAYRFYVGMSAYSVAQVSDNGTSGSPQGVVEAVTGSVELTTGATNWFALLGGEFTVSANAGSSVARKAIISLNNWPTDVVQGSHTDAHIWSTAHTGGPGSKVWAKLDDDAGVFPISTGGTLIQMVAALSTPSIATGIDFAGITITGNVIQWNSGASFLAGSGAAKFATLSLNEPLPGGSVLGVEGLANAYAAIIASPATLNESFGLNIKAGTSASDFPLAVQSAGGSNFWLVRGDGSWDLGVPAGTYGIGMSNVGGITLRTPFSGGHNINGATSFLNAIGVNGASPPAQVTGWGTPTGASVEANFAAGAGQTMAVISAAVAKIITDMKAVGIYGA